MTDLATLSRNAYATAAELTQALVTHVEQRDADLAARVRASVARGDRVQLRVDLNTGRLELVLVDSADQVQLIAAIPAPRAPSRN